MGGDWAPATRFWGLTVINGAFLAIVGYVLFTRWNMPLGHFAAWTLILSGGLGNLFDRVSQQGLVTDFLNLGIGPLRTGIFNVADMAITGGFALFALLWWREASTARQRACPGAEAEAASSSTRSDKKP
jgi:signal peptidase II